MYEEIIDKIIDDLTKLKRAVRLLGDRAEFNRRIRICLLKILSKHLGPGTRDLVHRKEDFPLPLNWSLSAGTTKVRKTLESDIVLSSNFSQNYQERKYPDFYYNLSKSQQWKFRKKNNLY